MADPEFFNVLQLIQAVFAYVLLGVSLTKILSEMPSPSAHPIWAWIPLANFYVLIAQVGQVGFWSTSFKAIAAGTIIMMAGTALAVATESLFVGLLGVLASNLVMGYILWSPVTRRGQLPNADRLAMLAGVPLVQIFVLPYIAWHGDWS